MSMWKGKKDAQNGDQLEPEVPQDDRASRRSYEPSRRTVDSREEPTERTRLLDRPRPPNADGFLDPDDPAVRDTLDCAVYSTDLLHRFRPTICGRSALCDT